MINDDLNKFFTRLGQKTIFKHFTYFVFEEGKVPTNKNDFDIIYTRLSSFF